MIAAEEFTFPVISSNATDTVNLTLLPPLWRISDSDETTSAARQRRPFASQIIKTDDEAEKGQGAEAEAESQEKMDLLWEDFNEELQSSADSSGSEFSEETSQHHCDEFEDLEECANVRQLKLIRAKPKKMESLVKVMKKLFSLSNQQKSNHH
ncbi:uncharacterized protein LOC131004658 [Salvia miltiorrhiza]|uniref:uncharacterized protein LOC131004658 n=1 Tax=Salvia miltiorrhiza TaxID=226208 RepID=UPI0025ACCDE4|nr:uncharacterized protein LOC131004658 [Salvia miltiorrhiza]